MVKFQPELQGYCLEKSDEGAYCFCTLCDRGFVDFSRSGSVCDRVIQSSDLAI
ncbi:MAG: hypothetical protein V7K89_17850 [Nostoc sp.]|uniref:hypothetical protein n=1 Tax=Nostoc sp. TaxID=1180 RepID=UPI002FF75F63